MVNYFRIGVNFFRTLVNFFRKAILRKYIKHYTIGGRAYPVRHYPIAIRLRDRKGRAILCIASIPQSGDSSGAILGVRSIALLHLGLLYEVYI